MTSFLPGSVSVSVFGESHGEAIGVTLGGLPAGESVDLGELQTFLNRRAPGNSPWSSARREADVPEFLSGLHEGVTTGTPLTAVIRNRDVRKSDYVDLSRIPRPGHADFTAYAKYGEAYDASGGGHFSGRLTAPLCIAGGICLQILKKRGISVRARIASVAGITDDAPFSASVAEKPFPAVSEEAAARMVEAILAAKAEGDSVGGVIECVAEGLPAGLGDPMFYGMENRISQLVFAIPAVKGVEFGSGFASAALRGSENNDEFVCENGTVRTSTNHCGGILGGITDGMPLTLRLAVKPTPSIAKPQQSVDLRTKEPTPLCVVGRHDPCIAPRAVPCVEAAVALAILGAWLDSGRR